MPVFENSRGRRLDVNPPPLGIFPELDEVTEKYEKLRRDRKVTATRLGGLRGQRERLIDEERIALARALRDETPEPKSKLPAIEKEIKVADERLAALEEAIDLVLEEMIEVTDENRDAWVTEALEQVATTQGEYQQAVEELARASQEVLARIALLSWTRLFPEHEVSYRVRGSSVLGLRGPNSDAYPLAEVIEALRQDSQVEYDPTAWGVSRDPIGAQIQARHDEKRRNEEKGLGYLTDAEITEGLTPELVAKGL